MENFDYTIEQYILESKWEDLPEEVRERVKGCFIDLMGALVVGSRSRQCRAGKTLAKKSFPAGNVAVVGDTETYSFLGATAVMGHASNAFDIDDGYSLLRAHPGTSFISGILAAAYDKDLTLRDFLNVLEMAYEVTIRDGLALLDYYHFYHGSGTLGPFGIVAGAGRIYGFSKEQLRNALAVAEFNAPLAPGVISVEYPAMNKDGVPFGAVTGALAIEETLSGFTGNRTFLHMENAAGYTQTLGKKYYIMDLYFKPYTCCRWAHPAVYGCIRLVKDNGLDYHDISKVNVQTFRQAAVMTKCVPWETDAAQYNIGYPTAAALVKGDVGFSEVYEDYLDDPDVLEMLGKLNFEVDEEFDKLFPANRYCRVKIIMNDGKVYRSEALEPYGEPKDHIRTEWLSEKFRRITGPVLKKEAQEEFLRSVLNDDGNIKIRDIMDRINCEGNWLR